MAASSPAWSGAVRARHAANQRCSSGAPFLVLSAGAPLLQRWFAAWRARTAPDHAGDDAATYALYAASNAGSLVALLGYPLLVESRLGLSAQSRWWSVAYATFGALLLGCAAVVARGGGPAFAPALAGAGTAPRAPTAVVTRSARARWTLLAFVPSALLLALTRYLTTDIAPVPLLWVLPLAVYLLTFIVAFAPGARPPFAMLDRATALLLPVLAVLVILDTTSPLALVSGTHLVAFGLVALWCHQALADTRPDVAHLTEYYLWISLGGLLGGVFNALLAPALFSGLAEYPISVALAAVARAVAMPPGDPLPPPATTRLGLRLQAIAGLAAPTPGPRARLLRRAAVPLIVGTVAWAAARHVSLVSRVADVNAAAWYGGAAVLLCVVLRADRVAYALAIAALLAGGALGQRARQASVLLRARSFYGAYTVRDASPRTTSTVGGQSRR